MSRPHSDPAVISACENWDGRITGSASAKSGPKAVARACWKRLVSLSMRIGLLPKGGWETATRCGGATLGFKPAEEAPDRRGGCEAARAGTSVRVRFRYRDHHQARRD